MPSVKGISVREAVRAAMDIGTRRDAEAARAIVTKRDATRADENGIGHWLSHRDIVMTAAAAWILGAVLAGVSGVHMAHSVGAATDKVRRAPVNVPSREAPVEAQASIDWDGTLVMPEVVIYGWPPPGAAQMQGR
jgi:hypothetical protein